MSQPELQLLIVGGGVHGTFLSHSLTHWAPISRDGVRVLDPHAEPLEYWYRNTRACGMRYLRSPSSHNLDLDFRALRRWARFEAVSEDQDFIEPYTRPSLRLFNLHTQRVIEENRLGELRIRGRATQIRPYRGGVAVRYEIDGGEESVTARLVILALSRAEQPRYPKWAWELIQRGAPVEHIFDPVHRGAVSRSGPARGDLLVIGGGVTAVQLALSLSKQSGRTVKIVSRHEPRVRMFDSNPCYIGPRCLPSFRETSEYGQRRDILRRERYPGSLPPYVDAELRTAMVDGRVEFIGKQVCGAEISDGCVRLELARHGSGRRSVVEADRVYVATGFHSTRPGGAVVDNLIAESSLPVAPCGYPTPERDLYWGAGVYVAGSLAELELGPASLNIIGAHNAAKLIAPEISARLG